MAFSDIINTDAINAEHDRLVAEAVASVQAKLDQANVTINANQVAMTQAEADLTAANLALTIAKSDLAAASTNAATMATTIAALKAEIVALKAQIAAQPPVVTPPVASTVYDLKTYKDLAAAKADMGLPDATYVDLKAEWRGLDLESIFRKMNKGEVLVVPADIKELALDTSRGFMAASVTAVRAHPTEDKWHPVNRTYADGKAVRTWFAMARSRKGIVALGPLKIRAKKSTWSQPAQIKDSDPGTHGYEYKGTDGKVVKELKGCQEKLIESEDSHPIYANFELIGDDFGGVAYHGLSTRGGFVRRVYANGAHRGFSGAPNGESGGLTATSGYDWKGVRIVCTLAGKRVASSPFMVNNSTGGKMEDIDTGMSNFGMPTIWGSSGKHVWTRFTSKFNGGHGMNVEKCSNLDLQLIDPVIWHDRQGTGSKHAPDGIGGRGMPLAVGSYGTGTVKVAMTGADLDLTEGPTKGSLNVQSYAGAQQVVITVTDKAKKPIPVKVYGNATTPPATS